MTCPICSGSGEKDHATLSGYMTLDCTAEGCTAATERAALEAANKAAEPMTVYDQRWFAYQEGVKAATEKARKDAEEADLDARHNIEKACGLPVNSRNSYTWGFLISYIKAACKEEG